MFIPPQAWRRCLAGSVILVSTFLSTPASIGGEAFVEDFSSMSNGSGEPASLQDGNAHGWEARGIETWVVGESGGRKQLKSLLGLAGWHALGRPHGLSVPDAGAVDIFMTILQKKSHSSAWVWLADETQNGYGVEYVGATRGVRIFKLRGNDVPFGPAKDSAKWSQEMAKGSEGQAKITESIEDDVPVTVRLRIEREAVDGPVKLSAWVVCDSAGLTGSAEAPLATAEDRGDGETFADSKNVGGPAPTLSGLTHLAFSASNNKDGGIPTFESVGLEIVSRGTASKTGK